MPKNSIMAVVFTVMGIFLLVALPPVGIGLIVWAVFLQINARDKYRRAYGEAVKVAEAKRDREMILAAKSLP